MKKLVVLLFVTVVNVSTFANNINPTKDVKSGIRKEIVKLLGKADFKFDNNVKTYVDFIINKKGQIIVLNIESNNERIDSYVKSKLNYKFVSSPIVAGKTFRMPLTLVKE